MADPEQATRAHIEAMVETVASLHGWRIEQELPADWVEPPHVMPMLHWHLTRVVRVDETDAVEHLVVRLPESIVRFRPANAWRAIEYKFEQYGRAETHQG